jgi:hypothetical protein
MMRAFEKVFRRFYKASRGKDPGTTDIIKLIRHFGIVVMGETSLEQKL